MATIHTRQRNANSAAAEYERQDKTYTNNPVVMGRLAVLKALGAGLGAADWHDIEVVRTEQGAPNLVITGRARALADELLFGRLTEGGRLTVDLESKTGEDGKETQEVKLDIQPPKKSDKAKAEPAPA